MFVANMNSSTHVGNRKKDILNLRKSPTQGLDDTTLTTEKEHAINFTEHGETFYLVCIRMGYVVICLLTVLKYTNSRLKILK